MSRIGAVTMSDPRLSPPQLDRYQLLDEVGRGGMAVVYRGLDRQLKREVAVKILHAHLSTEAPARQRFQREAEAVAKLHHDNVLEIYDYSGIDSPDSFIVTELIRGTTLKQFLERHPLAHPEVAVMIVYEVCRALGHAHALSIIHRDIKPENIMIREDGRIKLMDFGIAQIVDVTKLTLTGQLIGSPAYMAPELVLGKPLDFRADIFSAGTLLYQLATGSLPFTGTNPHEVLKRIADGEYPAPELVNRRVDSQLSRIIDRALQHDPSARYESTTELIDDLLGFLESAGLESPRVELVQYFRDPASYDDQLQERVITALLRSSRESIAQGNSARALRTIDRLLCSEPHHPEALELLERLSRGRRWLRSLIAVATTAIFVGSGWAVLAWLHGQRPLQQKPAAATSVVSDAKQQPVELTPSATTHDPSGGVATKRTSGVAHDDLGHEPAVLAKKPKVASRRAPASARRASTHGQSTPGRREPEPPAEEQVVLRRIEIVPVPKAVTIWLNGKLLGPYGPQLRYLELPSGPVQLVFRNDACCFERKIEIDADRIPEQLPVRLPWKPGRLLVTVVPDVPADVGVGTVVARAGQAIDVPIPSYADTGQVEIEVTVSAEGFRTASRTAIVRANTTTNLTVQLRRSM